MAYRLGINVGDVVVEGERIYGDGVNIAARIESLADGGGISVSANVHEQVKNKLSLAFTSQGEQSVKNIADPVRVYKVQLESDGTAPATVSQERPAPRRVEEKSLARRWPMAALALVAVLVVSTGVRVWQDASQSPSIWPESRPAEESAGLPLPDKPSLAVLPFTNLSGDPEQEYFSDGITEDLITDLSKIASLFVIARHSTFAYKGRAVNIAAVGRELGVRYVLEGSTRKAASRVRINAQLVDATTGGHLWAERYDRDLQDIFALQDEITQKIVFALKVTLTPEEQARFRQAPTDNLEAYDYFLRGVESHMRFTQERNIQARQLWEQALELDPDYAGAYASLGLTYFNEWALQWSQDPQSLERALELAQRAIVLDNSLPYAHRVLGEVYLWQKQYEQAIAQAEQAITLNPNDADGYANLAQILTWVGRPEEALEVVEKAMRLNPHYPVWYLWTFGHASYLTQRYEEAIAAFKRTLAHNPDHFPAHAYLAIVYNELGREEEAQAEEAECRRLSPHASLEVFRQRLPYKDPAASERVAAALRKAGVK